MSGCRGVEGLNPRPSDPATRFVFGSSFRRLGCVSPLSSGRRPAGGRRPGVCSFFVLVGPNRAAGERRRSEQVLQHKKKPGNMSSEQIRGPPFLLLFSWFTYKTPQKPPKPPNPPKPLESEPLIDLIPCKPQRLSKAPEANLCRAKGMPKFQGNLWNMPGCSAEGVR